MLDYRVEPLTQELIEEMVPRQREYYEEVAGPFHNFGPDVDWKTYLIAEQTNRLKVICGRNEAKQLHAVAVLVIMPHQHYACICASLPLLFLTPEYRGGREGIRLLRLAESVSLGAGAQMLMTHGGVHNGVYKIFEKMDYQDFGRYFVKVLPNSDPNPVFKEK